MPRAQGRSWKKGRQRSQSVPVVLCWQRQASRPLASGAHSLAWPLHLHLGRDVEDGGLGTERAPAWDGPRVGGGGVNLRSPAFLWVGPLLWLKGEVFFF